MEVDSGAPVVASSERTLDASPQTIWDVLVDVDRWPTWNSAVKMARMGGPLAEGTSFHWKASSLTISSVFRAVDPPRTLGWSGQLSASQRCTCTRSTLDLRGRWCARPSPGVGCSLPSSRER